ncbi:MAG: endolytic transglycosylase MltG [Nitrospirota bacterium]
MFIIRKIVFFLIFLVAADVSLFFLNPIFSEKIKKEVLIVEGASFQSVADLLKERQLVSNSLYFRFLGKWTKEDQHIKPGVYNFHTAMWPIEILEMLVSGKIAQKEVTFREGLTSSAIARILYEAGLGPEEDFLFTMRDPRLLHEFGIGAENLEGYLFPETYFFSVGTSPDQIIRQMVEQFKLRFTSALQRQASFMEMTQREVVTLASIIDKETASNEERTIISAVFHNRIRLGMRLQSDPTVIFGIENFNGNLTRKDLMTPTPYNTYTIPGLPPGPIGNPGDAALTAALFPAKVSYLYFVSRNDGTHYFSKTLEEHNAAVNRFQKNR